MTRPIFEPMVERALAAQGFASNQLFRRPPRIAETSHPWAMLRDGSVDITSLGSPFPVDFDVATKNHDPDDDYFSWSITDAGDSGNDRFVLTLKLEGIYFLDLVGSFTNTGTGTGTAKLRINPSNSYNPFGVNDEKFVAEIGGDWNTAGDLQASASLRVFCLYSANTNCTLEPTVTLTGVTTPRTFETSYMKALYLEAHGPTADWITEEV